MFPERSSAKRSKTTYPLRSPAELIVIPAAIANGKPARVEPGRSDDRFRLLADNAPVMIWICNESAKCTYFNKKWLAHTGRAFEEELCDGWAEGVHPEDRAGVMNRFKKAFAARSPFELEYRLRNASGQYPWVIDRGEPIYS